MFKSPPTTPENPLPACDKEIDTVAAKSEI